MNKTNKLMVETANSMFTNEHVSEEQKTAVFGFVSHLLLVNNQYWGYNYFKQTDDGLRLDPDGKIKQFYIV